jgi:flagellar biosynthesis repressor protein FlbT
MNNSFCLSIKARQRLFINGAVLRFDRKVGIELLNDAVFLLESHVLQPEEITTPLRQLYFVAQTMMIDPNCAQAARPVFSSNLDEVKHQYSDPVVSAGLEAARSYFNDGKIVDVLKTIRALFPREAMLIPVSAGHAATDHVQRTKDE